MPPHVHARETTFPDRGYFPPNLLRSTDRKYTSFITANQNAPDHCLCMVNGVLKFYQPLNVCNSSPAQKLTNLMKICEFIKIFSVIF